jgi:hypothetical protein
MRGQHVTSDVPFPQWVPQSIRAAAETLSEESADAEFAGLLRVRPRV